MLKHLILPIVIISTALAVFFILKQSKSEEVTIQKPEKVWRVNTVTALFKDISPEITIYGRVETPREATLKSALEADIVSINILEGSNVNDQQILIKLDESDVQLIIEQHKADLAENAALISSEQERFKRDKGLLEQESRLLELTDKAVERTKKLEQTRLSSQANLEDMLAAKQRQLLVLKRLQYDITEHPARMAQLKAQRSQIQALLKRAQLDLKRTVISAPFSGRIAKLNVAEGDRVRSGDTLLSIYDLDALEVRAQFPSRYIKQIRTMLTQGEPLVANTVVDDEIVICDLDRLSGEVSVDSGGIDGLFKLAGTHNSLALGFFVELNLKLTKQNDVIELPFNALYGLEHVYVLKEGYLQKITIERVGEITIENGEKRLLIRSAEIRQGDQIVSTQLPNAITGLRVEALSD